MIWCHNIAFFHADKLKNKVRLFQAISEQKPIIKNDDNPSLQIKY